MRLKPVLSIALIIVFIVSILLTGCGQTPSSAGQSVASGGAAQTSAASEAAPASEDGASVLRYAQLEERCKSFSAKNKVLY